MVRKQYVTYAMRYNISHSISYAFYGNFIRFFPITQILRVSEQNEIQNPILHRKIL